MALINCPECNKEVSDSAVACPFCGFGVASHVKRNRMKNKVNSINLDWVNSACKFLFVISIVIYLFVSVGLYNYYAEEQIKAEQKYEDIQQKILNEDPSVDINSFKYMSAQKELAKEMEEAKNSIFLTNLGILAVVDLVVFVIFIKTKPTNVEYTSQFADENDSDNIVKDDTFAPWRDLRIRQDIKNGMCTVCGKKHCPRVYYEFEDQFGKSDGYLCYDCFLAKYK